MTDVTIYGWRHRKTRKLHLQASCRAVYFDRANCNDVVFNFTHPAMLAEYYDRDPDCCEWCWAVTLRAIERAAS